MGFSTVEEFRRWCEAFSRHCAPTLEDVSDFEALRDRMTRERDALEDALRHGVPFVDAATGRRMSDEEVRQQIGLKKRPQ